eukprot:TRINITY_DN17609_c1_g1_i8.p1 TRINITY_DN17609_c1_g1~~TRINITY_DN17609_c1_g1_i8.p1  ORF type:complete len:212 (+),score=54.22 TRINITY_DN17609_c1_g1_i8:49-684(+)
MQEALDWVKFQLEGVLVPGPTACCCAPAKGQDAGGRYADLVVLSDWDTGEGVPGFAGRMRPDGSLEAPDMSRAMSSREPFPGDELEDPAAAKEVVVLRELMKQFVQEMVIGKDFYVVVEEGQTEKGWLKLSPNLLSLRLDAAGVSHEILLRNIKDVRPGKMAGSFGPVRLDEKCATLMLKNSECITFRHDSITDRDRWCKCIKVLALALEQ